MLEAPELDAVLWVGFQQSGKEGESPDDEHWYKYDQCSCSRMFSNVHSSNPKIIHKYDSVWSKALNVIAFTLADTIWETKPVIVF